MNNSEDYRPEKKEAILKLLKQGSNSNERGMPTSKIAVILRINYYDLEIILSQLQQDGKVLKSNGGRTKYWRINDGKQK